VLDPLQREVIGKYLFDSDTKTAYLEVANCSGLQMLRKDERNPHLATSAVSYENGLWLLGNWTDDSSLLLLRESTKNNLRFRRLSICGWWTGGYACSKCI